MWMDIVWFYKKENLLCHTSQQNDVDERRNNNALFSVYFQTGDMVTFILESTEEIDNFSYLVSIFYLLTLSYRVIKGSSS